MRERKANFKQLEDRSQLAAARNTSSPGRMHRPTTGQASVWLCAGRGRGLKEGRGRIDELCDNFKKEIVSIKGTEKLYKKRTSRK